MALTFKTPGVYVQEISKLPPSVAEVETAIPAFIGYTQIAKEKIDGDLDLVPTRITSLLEYEQYFGGPANETGISVEVDVDGNILVNGPANRSPFIMYYSMQMYFANGGGPCYITSVGQYLTPPADKTVATLVQFTNLKNGLDEIKKQDEPTLLVFPDATNLLDDNDFYTIYTLALTQCGDLQDRFTILDTYNDSDVAIADLRSGITDEQDLLKYGAAYYPQLATTLDYKYLDSGVTVTDTNAPTYAGQVTSIADSIKSQPLTAMLAELAAQRVIVVGTTNVSALTAAKAIMVAKTTQIQDYLDNLTGKLENVENIGGEAIVENGDLAPHQLQDAIDAVVAWNEDNVVTPVSDEIPPLFTALNSAAIDQDEIKDAIDPIIALFGAGPTSLTSKINALKNTGGELPDMITVLGNAHFNNGDATLASYELNDNVMYNKIKAEIGRIIMTLPPSSAVAGVYARTDANKGVWTAPANASLNYTIAPTVFIDNQMQDGMNVTTTGKSVNAIRSFTGRGTLIWGARTLTGNSNEWRYVPVRRFFNFAEESIKKASEPFVFQSNDANTWVKVKGMIENFLTQQWKAGALQGAKPEQAFYVSVGLGQTMTAQDVLEGRMIIEVGMAVVRPAEFIVLKFSHKMPEA